MEGLLCFLILMFSCSLVCHTSAMLSPDGINYEVQALMDIKNSLNDTRCVLSNWDESAVDPCSWTMVTCSTDKFVVGLAIPSQGLSGRISPHIGKLTHLEIVLLQNNNISGVIPAELGNLPRLKTVDLSDNKLTGEVPASLAQIKSLQYLRLNNNSLTGAIPLVLANMTQLTFLDLSFNNLNGPVPRLLAKTFNILGNPMICATGKEPDCNGTTPMALPFSFNSSQSKKLFLTFGIM
nr:protein NSP-INTERACTING KINASE 2-like [Ipomoea batatas]